MEVDYYSKYLKYKAKYLELKNQMAGGKFYCCKICDCLTYEQADPNTNVCKCGHPHLEHHTYATYTKECTRKNLPDCTKCNCYVFNSIRRDRKKNVSICGCGHEQFDHKTPYPDYDRM